MRVVVGRIVDREHAEGGVGLAREGVQALAERGVGCAHDEDAEDRRVVRRCVVALDGRAGCAHARRGARAAASLARGAAAQRKGDPRAPLRLRCEPRSALLRGGACRLALGCRLLGCRLALGRRLPLCRLALGCRLLAAGLRLAAVFRFAGLRLAADFLAALFAWRLALGCALPLGRLALGCRLLGCWTCASPLTCASPACASQRSTSWPPLLRFAGLRLAVDRFLADSSSAAMLPPSLSVRMDVVRAPGPYDAIRFRRRRSRSLIPPHTP